MFEVLLTTFILKENVCLYLLREWVNILICMRVCCSVCVCVCVYTLVCMRACVCVRVSQWGRVVKSGRWLVNDYNTSGENISIITVHITDIQYSVIFRDLLNADYWQDM